MERKTGLSQFLCTQFEVLGWSTWIAKWEMANLGRFLSCWPSVSGLVKFGVPILASLRDQPEPPRKAFNINYHKDDAALNPVFGSTAPQKPLLSSACHKSPALRPLSPAKWCRRLLKMTGGHPHGTGDLPVGATTLMVQPQDVFDLMHG